MDWVVSVLCPLRQLDEEIRKLKQLVADLSLDKAMLQDVLRSSEAGPTQSVSRQASAHLRHKYSSLIRLSLTGWYYRHIHLLLDAPLLTWMREIVEVRLRYGTRRIHILLRRKG